MKSVEQVLSNDEVRHEDIEVLSADEIKEVSGGIGSGKMNAVVARPLTGSPKSGGAKGFKFTS